ncbi:MAG TPA: response regulator transcription factor [Phycisphaerae bacterium]|nr:response regulator transcription factor [Phycisphaerales bacterium]HRX83794.1 response regulator transcription factor [Phycisphaerae bacterium]
MRGANDSNTVLLIEDDDRIRLEVSDALQAAGFEVQVCTTLAGAREAVRGPCNLVLLDLGLPDGDGLDLCRELRAGGSDMPIIILTARDAPEQRVRGLDVGADDYVVKPFHIPELIARIRGVLRRSGQTQAAGAARFGDLWIDPQARTAGRRDKRLDLKPREFDLLLFLMNNPGRAWTRDQLIEKVWGKSFEGDARTVDLHVARLRSKIEDDPADPRYVETVWGVGYRFQDEP